jgi:hypothetical protein
MQNSDVETDIVFSRVTYVMDKLTVKILQMKLLIVVSVETPKITACMGVYMNESLKRVK